MDNAFSHAVSSTSGRCLKCQNMRVCHIRDVNAPNSDIAVCWCCILVNMLVKSPDKSFLTRNKAWATGDFSDCSLDPPMGLVKVRASWPRYPPMVNKINHHENVKWRSRFRWMGECIYAYRWSSWKWLGHLCWGLAAGEGRWPLQGWWWPCPCLSLLHISMQLLQPKSSKVDTTAEYPTTNHIMHIMTHLITTK